MILFYWQLTGWLANLPWGNVWNEYNRYIVFWQQNLLGCVTHQEYYGPFCKYQ
jgi:hypothetical protein